MEHEFAGFFQKIHASASFIGSLGSRCGLHEFGAFVVGPPVLPVLGGLLRTRIKPRRMQFVRLVQLWDGSALLKVQPHYPRPLPERDCLRGFSRASQLHKPKYWHSLTKSAHFCVGFPLVWGFSVSSSRSQREGLEFDSPWLHQFLFIGSLRWGGWARRWWRRGRARGP